MSRPHRAFFAILALALSITLGVGELSASGRSEDPLAEARKLLSQGRLSDALKLNMDVFIQDAEQQDAVLKLLDGILSKSKEFNQTIQRFAAVDFTKPGATEEGRRLIGDLRRIDANPNSETGRILDLLESRLLFEETGRLYDKLMDSVLPLLQAGKYYEAAEAYLPGFSTLARETFDNAVYAKSGTLHDEVLAAVGEVEAGVKDAVARRPELEGALGRVTALALQGDAAGVGASLTALLEELDHLDRQRDAIAGTASFLEQRHAKLFKELGEYDNFIWFSARLIVGRSEVPDSSGGKPLPVREGIFKALEMQWERTATTVADLLESKSRELLAQGLAAYRAGDYGSVDGYLDRASALSMELNRVLGAWATQFKLGQGLKPTSKGWSLIVSLLPRMLAAQERAKESGLYRELDQESAFLRETGAITSAGGGTELESIQTSRKEIGERRGRLDEIRGRWNLVVERYAALAGTRASSSAAVEASEAALAVTAETQEALDREDTRLAEIQVASEYAAHAKELDRLSADLAEGRAQILGVDVVRSTVSTETGEEVRSSRVERYPAKGGEILAAVSSELAALQAGLGSSARAWQAETRRVLASTVVQGFLSREGELLASAVRQAAESEEQLRLADENLRKAAQLKAQGIGYLEQAKRSLDEAKRADVRSASVRFQAARDGTQQAASALLSSLAYAEDAEVRRIRDVDMLALQNDIGRAEIQIAVQEVRRYLAEGKRLFNLGDYLRANDEYKKAESRWNDVSNTRNAEIDLALKSVENALLYQTQRVITTDNPIYDVVMQLYNNAREAYNDAVKLLARALKVDGLKRLDDADKTLGRMRELVPYYQPMGVLALEITRLRDPGEFGRVFAQRFSEAVAKTAGRPGEALSELQDLQQIDAKYRGLDDAIYQAKLRLGLIAAPPKPQDTNRSVQLTAQARTIYVSRKVEKYPEAVTLLDQAIALWDSNPDATALKDIITGLIGGQRPLVLPTDSEQQYQEARSLFGRKDYFGAKTIIDRLMKDPIAKNYLPLIELKRRVDLETG